MTAENTLTKRVEAAFIPAEGLEIEIAASDAQRTALAQAYDLIAVDSLGAVVRLTPAVGESVLAAGRVQAAIVQSCVVSLEPVNQRIDETFETLFAPVDSPEIAAKKQAEVLVAPDDADPPEPIENGMIDVGALVEEIFALAIDPYPRAPGAVLPPGTDTAEAASESPFAVLRQRDTIKR
jgi:uncharacterized metal-binding protein YceD (DUF177 family)